MSILRTGLLLLSLFNPEKRMRLHRSVCLSVIHNNLSEARFSSFLSNLTSSESQEQFRITYNCLSDWLQAGRSGDRIPVGARFSSPVQTGPGAHPFYCKMGTVSFPGVKSCRGVTLTPLPFLVPWSRKGRVISLLPLRAVQRLQSLSACTRVHFILPYNCLGYNCREHV
jgi:hypothetical protein